MADPVAKARTLTLAPGNKRVLQRGFTLIELLVVVTLVAIASASVTMALRDPTAAQLEREGERLITLIEMARAEARAGTLAVRWRPVQDAEGRHFRFLGLPERMGLPTRWLGEPPTVTIAGNATELLLGPEPLIPAQSLQLQLGPQRLRISTDGLQPFAAQALAP